MTPAETAKRLAWYERHKDVMRAHVMGATIEMEDSHGNMWIAATPTWNTDIEYRVRPSPKKMYRVVDRNGNTYLDTFDLHYAQTHLSNAQLSGAEKPYTLEEYLQVL